jgi:hypothetical protein
VRHRVGGGRGADGRGVGQMRQRRSPVAGRREAEQEETLVNRGGVGWRRRGHEDGRRGVERAGGRVLRRDAQGRASGVGSVDRTGRGGHTWLSWSVGPLGPGDGPLIHHPM